jgi:DNA-binding response OmpR family regulator
MVALRVLVSVDTSASDVVRQGLQGLGHETIECADPVEAVGLFITKPFELFVCDLRLSDTGVEVAGTMKRMDGGKNLRVLFLVRDAAHSDAIKARVKGAFEVAGMLRDPLSEDELVKAVEKAAPAKRAAAPPPNDMSGSWPQVGGEDEPAPAKEAKPLTQREKMRLLVVKLSRERERVEGKPAHEILRLEADPDRTEIEEARRVLKRRYMKVVKSDDVPNEAKALAAELAQLVDHAYVELCAVGPRQAQRRRLMTDEERLVKYIDHARELVEAQDWDKADKLLAQARLLKQDDPVVLALAGWCRYHNPVLDRYKREEHAKDLLMMAEQFDPYQFDCQYYLAQFFHEQNDLENSWRRIVRATRVHPEHQGAQNLYQKIKKMGGKLLIPEDDII